MDLLFAYGANSTAQLLQIQKLFGVKYYYLTIVIVESRENRELCRNCMGGLETLFLIPPEPDTLLKTSEQKQAY
jgi:hypothetical protein